MLRFLPLFFAFFLATQALAEPLTLQKNETWSGIKFAKEAIIVPENVTLTIQAGTEIVFSEGASLNVLGRLLAKGSLKNPVIFRSSNGSKAGSWQGIVFEQGSREGSELLNVRIEGASQGVTMTGAKVRIADATLRHCGKGILSGVGAYLLVERTTISDMNEGGIDASVGSQGKITGCQIRRVANFGIQIGKKSGFFINDNQISNAKIGISISGDSPPVERNSIDHCDAGIVLLQTTPNTIVRGNKITDCKSGIACHQFAAPVLEKNVIERCEVGIDCFQASSPTVRQNQLKSNQRGISCIQLCNPAVTANDFNDNKTGIYLHLSSYPQIHNNNFDGNHFHIELDNMSYDWEVRAKGKPVRSREKQSELLSMKERSNPKAFQIEAGKEGYVNAKENFWGKTTTAEMSTKGDNANISTIQDAYDVPTRTYEGWPGEYKQDQVKYNGWKKTRIAGTFNP